MQMEVTRCSNGATVFQFMYMQFSVRILGRDQLSVTSTAEGKKE